MATIHCGFVPFQNKYMNQTAGLRRNSSTEPFRSYL